MHPKVSLPSPEVVKVCVSHQAQTQHAWVARPCVYLRYMFTVKREVAPQTFTLPRDRSENDGPFHLSKLSRCGKYIET